MSVKKTTKFSKLKTVFAVFLILASMVTGVAYSALSSHDVYAVPDTVNTNDADQTNQDQSTREDTNQNDLTETNSNTEQQNNKKVKGDACKVSLGALGWVVCPLMNKITEAVDWLYDKIEDILIINPISTDDNSPIYTIWKYCLSVTNIVFIIFFLVVIYSQITGWGITNYGLKKALPKLVVMAIMVNLSFLICSLAVDVSNIIGNSLRGLFESVEMMAVGNVEGASTTTTAVSMAEMYTSMAGGTALAIGAGVVAFELGSIWMLIPTALGAIVAVATGLITIALRQAVVVLLVMISPLAFVAGILPNTEDLYKKWKSLLTKMLVFYPVFSLLFGASSLAGFAIISSSRSGFGVLLGVAVQIFPLFFSWKLMQMSGTFLGGINARMRALAEKPLAANRAWAEGKKQNRRANTLLNGVTPSARLMQFLSNRKIAHDEELAEKMESVKLRGQAYAANRNYRKNGVPSREGEEAYARQARNMEYSRMVERHKDNMNKGLGQLEVVKAKASTAQKARLHQLDIANLTASDDLRLEKARGEKIEYENATGFHKRMDNAINIHFDDVNAGRRDYETHKMHGDESRDVARARYATMRDIMENDVQGIHYAAASAAHEYDTHKKVVEGKMQKYFELTPPTKDVEYRLGELTSDQNAIENVDSIIAGLRVLNQRGDTDLVKKHMEELLSHNVQLGTHASQALASFLMFEVKDSDPWLRRFGKYINLETARVYNNNERQVMEVTYDEYVKGYHDGEPITENNPTGRMYAKKGMRSLTEGTSLDSIERTALSNLDESLKKAYGYDAQHPGHTWDVSGWLKKREEIQTAFEPAFLSASLKWLSGSEQINSGVKFWTGYEMKQKKDEHGNVVVDENGDPEYNLAPVWKDREFAGHEDEVQKYFRRKTNDYFRDQTTGQILGMRTDFRDATMEHLVDSYLEESSDDETSEERMRKYEEARMEIQTRYGDRTPEEAKKLRAKDLKKVKMDLAGKQLRKILGATGKLEQIYRTKRSGAPNNAKDWLRGWVGLDDEEAMYDEVKYYERQRRKQREAASGSSDGGSGEAGDMRRIYDAETRDGIRDSLEQIWEKNKDASGNQFYDIAMDAIREWFGEGESLVGRRFKKYYERKAGTGIPDAYDLKKYLEDLLHNPDNFPDV